MFMILIKYTVCTVLNMELIGYMSKIVIVDIDETLVYSRSKLPGSIQFSDDEGQTAYTLPREGIWQFLQQLKEKDYRIISVTQGVVPFQRTVLEAAGVLDYFEEIYGWTSTARTFATRPDLGESKWVLVDNLHHEDSVLWEKAGWIGATLDPEINFVQCEPFVGDTSVACLTTLIPKIEEFLA